MADKIITIASVIRFKADDSMWRIFYILNGGCRMINLDSGGFDFRDMRTEEIITGINLGEI